MGLTALVGHPTGAMKTLLDTVMPHYDINEVHDVWIGAPPEVVYEAVRAVTPGEVRLFGPLMAARMIPHRLSGKPLDTGGDKPLLDRMTEQGFLSLGSRENAEIAIGAIGKFWHPIGNTPIRVANADAFCDFAQPGYAKAIIGFELTADEGGTRLVTETRIVGTSPDAKRKFRWYWRVIGLGSRLIRRSWLAAIRRRVKETP